MIGHQSQPIFLKNKLQTMKSSVITYVGWLLLLSAIGFYGYGIVEAILLSWSKTIPVDYDKYPETISTTISSMQALLLTNLGILLGISIAKPNSAVAKQLMLNSKNKIGLAVPLPNPLDIKEKIQLFALVIYILSLIGCLITWGHKSFSSKPEDVVAVISESGKMFLGVVLAYLTAVLSNKN